MLDLEDAVAASEKEAARAVTCKSALAAPEGGPLSASASTGSRSGLTDTDLDALAGALSRISLITIPDGRRPRTTSTTSPRASTRSSATAGVAAGSVAFARDDRDGARHPRRTRDRGAASPRIRTLLIGPADLGKDIGIELTAEGSSTSTRAAPSCSRRVTAGKERPIDGPYLRMDDDEGCAVSSAWARRLGFQGKVIIHPRQLPIAAAAFAPGERELAWAREVERAFREAEAGGV